MYAVVVEPEYDGGGLIWYLLSEAGKILPHVYGYLSMLK